MYMRAALGKIAMLQGQVHLKVSQLIQVLNARQVHLKMSQC